MLRFLVLRLVIVLVIIGRLVRFGLVISSGLDMLVCFMVWGSFEMWLVLKCMEVG